jgi:hypothetical protein
MAAGGSATRGPACPWHSVWIPPPNGYPAIIHNQKTWEMKLGQGILLRDTTRGVMANAYWKESRSLGSQGRVSPKCADYKIITERRIEMEKKDD